MQRCSAWFDLHKAEGFGMEEGGGVGVSPGYLVWKGG